MAEREAYARAWSERFGFECHPGLEIRDGDDIETIMGWLEGTAWAAIGQKYPSHMEVARYVEDAIKEKYPDRAYFVETEEDRSGVQVYQPYGMPRVR